MQQTATRLRCDPANYAKQTKEQVKQQRQHGIFSDEHTSCPKVNQRDQIQSSSRKPFGQSVKFDCMASLDYGQSTSYIATPDTNNYGNDALEALSRNYPARALHQPIALLQQPPEPGKLVCVLQSRTNRMGGNGIDFEHDTLLKEVERATGRDIDNLRINKTLTLPRIENFCGPCLRNSNCECLKCDGGGLSSSYMSNLDADAAPFRKKEPRTGPTVCRQNNSSLMATQSEMENSLALLKFRMSRRNARSAPTNKASLFVEMNTPRAVVHSARLPSSASISLDVPRPPPKQKNTCKTVVANRDFLIEDSHVHTSTFTGANVPQVLDEYAVGTENMQQCHNCSRKFNPASYQRHHKICEKVFFGQRKVFNMASKRLEGSEAEKLLREVKRNKKCSGSQKPPNFATEMPLNVKIAADWKDQSNSFRKAMKASRDVSKALKEGKELPTMQPSAPDPSLIQCKYCNRRFNEKAAERHINFCREKSKRNVIKGGAKRGIAAKPGSRATAVRKI